MISTSCAPHTWKCRMALADEPRSLGGSGYSSTTYLLYAAWEPAQHEAVLSGKRPRLATAGIDQLLECVLQPVIIRVAARLNGKNGGLSHLVHVVL